MREFGPISGSDLLDGINKKYPDASGSTERVISRTCNGFKPQEPLCKPTSHHYSSTNFFVIW